MELQIDPGSGALALGSEMTVYSAPDLKPALLAQTIVGQKLDLDLSRVREFDTAGLQLLLMLQRRTGGRLRIVACSHAVRSVLALCHLQDLLGDDLSPQEAA